MISRVPPETRFAAALLDAVAAETGVDRAALGGGRSRRGAISKARALGFRAARDAFPIVTGRAIERAFGMTRGGQADALQRFERLEAADPAWRAAAARVSAALRAAGPFPEGELCASDAALAAIRARGGASTSAQAEQGPELPPLRADDLDPSRCRALWSEVLRVALSEAGGVAVVSRAGEGGVTERARLIREARDWFRTPDFEAVAALAGLDADAVRAKLPGVLASERDWSGRARSGAALAATARAGIAA